MNNERILERKREFVERMKQIRRMLGSGNPRMDGQAIRNEILQISADLDEWRATLDNEDASYSVIEEAKRLIRYYQFRYKEFAIIWSMAVFPANT